MQTFIGTIMGFGGVEGSGLAQLVLGKNPEHYGMGDALDFPNIVHISSGTGLRAVVAAFGSMFNAIGEEIVFTVDAFGVMDGFTPVADWEGPLPPEGDDE